jgi:recombination protein RecA
METSERSRLIMHTLLQMEKQFGKGSVQQLGSRNVLPVNVISTGSISLDAALGVGGIPRGRVTEVFGPESSGKTTPEEEIHPPTCAAVPGRCLMPF